VLCSAI
jgi:hypothetical protein